MMMTNPEQWERISRELCAQFGYIYQEGEWLGGIHEDEPVYWPLRCALIEARCRVGELEKELDQLRNWAKQKFFDCELLESEITRLALREKEPKL